MWKFISLYFVIVVKATKLENFYGNWYQAAFYPVSTYAPVCIQYTFSPTSDNVQCTYADGNNATLMQMSIMTDKGQIIQNSPLPVMIVETPAEVMPALNMTCTYGDQETRGHVVIRLVNDNYFIMYHDNEPFIETSNEVEQNTAFLFVKNVVPESELLQAMMTIEDLKRRRGGMMCVKENYHGFSSANKV